MGQGHDQSRIQGLDGTMTVELIDKMGTDLSVVNAARVSYAKTKEVFDDKDERLIK